MFIYGNFCHGASNDRVKNQSAIFLYKTVDTLQQMTTAGYFNRAKLDLHIGDIIFATVESIKETTSYNTYVFRVLTVNEPITVEQISLGNGGGGTDSVSSVNGISPVDGNVEITGDNITATVGEEEATITQHLTTFAGEISAKVNIAQGAENAGKVMTVGEDGNVVPTAGYATESWVNQQIQTQIGTIETALAEV